MDLWSSRTLRTRELPGMSEEEIMRVKLSREDLISLANQGLAQIEQQASEAAALAPKETSESDLISYCTYKSLLINTVPDYTT